MKIKRVTALSFILVAAVCAAGCSQVAAAGETGEQQTEHSMGNETGGTVGQEEYLDTDVSFKKKAEITLSDGIKIDGTGAEVLEDNTIFISEGGEYVFTGELKDGMIYVDTKDAVEITLNGVTIANADGPAVLGQDSKAIYINSVSGTENIFNDGSEYEIGADGEAVGKGTIFSNDDLYFIGNGTISVTGNYQHAVKSDDSVFVKSGTLNLSSVKDGLNANETLMVDGGTIVVATAEEGLEGTNLIVNGGVITAETSDDCLNAGTLLQINGGMIYAFSSRGDAVDSNGDLEISGGFLIAHGADMPEGGLDCDENRILITGGTIIATGGSNSQLDDVNNTQYSILLGAASKGDRIGILDSEGNTVFAYETDTSYSNMMLSISGIEANKSYTIYTGGTISGGTETYGCYEGGTYEGGDVLETFTADTLIISAGGTAGMGGGFHGGRPEVGEPPEGKRTEEGKQNGGI